MTVDEAIICLSDMKIKVAIPKAAVQARLNNDALNMAIEALKCSEIPNNWIPCSERLPEEETDVLVTRKFLGCKDGSHGWNNHIPPSTYVEVAQYFNGEWTALSDEYKIARNRHTDPIAWMPLPEPYQGGGEEHETD